MALIASLEYTLPIECHLPLLPAGDASTGGKEVILVGHRRGVEGVVGHTGHVLALAVSFDGKFVVSKAREYVLRFLLVCDRDCFLRRLILIWLIVMF